MNLRQNPPIRRCLEVTFFQFPFLVAILVTFPKVSTQICKQLPTTSQDLFIGQFSTGNRMVILPGPQSFAVLSKIYNTVFSTCIGGAGGCHNVTLNICGGRRTYLSQQQTTHIRGLGYHDSIFCRVVLNTDVRVSSYSHLGHGDNYEAKGLRD